MKIVPLFMAFVLLIFGFAPTIASSFELVTKTETVVVNQIEIDIIRTADNFIVLYDTSGSMDEVYKDTGKKKIELAEAILKIRNAAMPPLKINAGLYTFTPKRASFSDKILKPYYKMQPYDKVEFAKAIDQLPNEASGITLLRRGLLELKEVLAGLSGRTVIFVFTDGKYTDLDAAAMATPQEILEQGKLPNPVEIARDLASKHDVSFYAIKSSSDKLKSKVLQAVASINESSRVISFEQFIEDPLLLSGALFVIDARVVQRAIDIEKIIGAKLKHLLFAYDSAAINPAYADGLQLLGEYLQLNLDADLSLSGHADSIGSQEYNMGLSRRRAESVATYLVDTFNLDPARISLHWYGKADPVASNGTKDGRALNRRVEGFVFRGK